MRHVHPDPKLEFYIGDVRNHDGIRDAMEGRNYMFHAAALKKITEPGNGGGCRVSARDCTNPSSRVCGHPGTVAFDWAKEKDRGVADHVRIEILEALVELRQVR